MTVEGFTPKQETGIELSFEMLSRWMHAKIDHAFAPIQENILKLGQYEAPAMIRSAVAQSLYNAGNTLASTLKGVKTEAMDIVYMTKAYFSLRQEEATEKKRAKGELYQFLETQTEEKMKPFMHFLLDLRESNPALESDSVGTLLFSLVWKVSIVRGMAEEKFQSEIFTVGNSLDKIKATVAKVIASPLEAVYGSLEKGYIQARERKSEAELRTIVQDTADYVATEYQSLMTVDDDTMLRFAALEATEAIAQIPEALHRIFSSDAIQVLTNALIGLSDEEITTLKVTDTAKGEAVQTFKLLFEGLIGLSLKETEAEERTEYVKTISERVLQAYLINIQITDRLRAFHRAETSTAEDRILDQIQAFSDLSQAQSAEFTVQLRADLAQADISAPERDALEAMFEVVESLERQKFGIHLGPGLEEIPAGIALPNTRRASTAQSLYSNFARVNPAIRGKGMLLGQLADFFNDDFAISLPLPFTRRRLTVGTAPTFSPLNKVFMKELKHLTTAETLINAFSGIPIGIGLWITASVLGYESYSKLQYIFGGFLVKTIFSSNTKLMQFGPAIAEKLKNTFLGPIAEAAKPLLSQPVSMFKQGKGVQARYIFSEEVAAELGTGGESFIFVTDEEFQVIKRHLPKGTPVLPIKTGAKAGHVVIPATKNKKNRVLENAGGVFSNAEEVHFLSKGGWFPFAMHKPSGMILRRLDSKGLGIPAAFRIIRDNLDNLTQSADGVMVPPKLGTGEEAPFVDLSIWGLDGDEAKKTVYQIVRSTGEGDHVGRARLAQDPTEDQLEIAKVDKQGRLFLPGHGLWPVWGPSLISLGGLTSTILNQLNILPVPEALHPYVSFAGMAIALGGIIGQVWQHKHFVARLPQDQFYVQMGKFDFSNFLIVQIVERLGLSEDPKFQAPESIGNYLKNMFIWDQLDLNNLLLHALTSLALPVADQIFGNIPLFGSGITGSIESIKAFTSVWPMLFFVLTQVTSTQGVQELLGDIQENVANRFGINLGIGPGSGGGTVEGGREINYPGHTTLWKGQEFTEGSGWEAFTDKGSSLKERIAETLGTSVQNIPPSAQVFSPGDGSGTTVYCPNGIISNLDRALEQGACNLIPSK